MISASLNWIASYLYPPPVEKDPVPALEAKLERYSEAYQTGVLNVPFSHLVLIICRVDIVKALILQQRLEETKQHMETIQNLNTGLQEHQFKLAGLDKLRETRADIERIQSQLLAIEKKK